MRIDSGDTTWMLVCTSLVMLMVLGVILFYGGMARKKNVLAVMMHGFVSLCVASVLWVVWGYSLAFGPDKGGVIGGLSGSVCRAWAQSPSRPLRRSRPSST